MMLKSRTGKQRIIKINNLILKFGINKFKRQNINVDQIILKITVE